MNNNQLNMLMEAAQKTFINELRRKIEEIEAVLTACEKGCTEDEMMRVLRFFHSINGTASTLGLDNISSVGKKWERRIRDLIKKGHSFDKDILTEAYEAVSDIKKKISYLGLEEESRTKNIITDSSEYTNMQDRGKILLVDDDISILKLLENALTLEGYKVYICDDSESAMDTIAVVRPDIIILDIMMPRVDGYELLEKIKSKPDYFDINVIFLSARGEVDDKIKGIKAGADEYIAKPFVIGEVITRVEMIMRRTDRYKEKLLKDCLTDAYSRYYFYFRIAEEFERYRRCGKAFSIAFIDIDYYKDVNDQYGHQTGDHVLKELVMYILQNIRKCDSIYRYGGEEFILLMPETTEEGAYKVIDRLRHGISCKPISVGGSNIYITISAGIRQVRDVNETVDEIISDADKAMYYAKKTGRNRVVVYDKVIDIRSLKKTLLIVDDENTILKLLRDRLSSIGYKVITAKDGTNAIKIAQDVQPDAIVLDIILPDMDGFEVCRQIKENANTRTCKIIMLSKKKQKKSIIKGLHIGADDYVTKPFSMSELEARIMRLLNSAH